MGIQKNWRYPIKVVTWVLVIFVLLVAALTSFSTAIVERIPDSFLLGTEDNFDAWLVSLWSSIIFFATIGVTSLLIGLHRPQDDIIESRLSYLFSSPKVTPKAMAYNKEQINKLSVFCSHVELRVFIEDIAADGKGFRVEIESRQILQNSLHNHDYVDEDIHFDVSADPIGEEEIIGEVKQIQLSSDSDKKLIWSSDRVFITKSEPNFSKMIPLEVKANSAACLTAQYWLWCAANEGCYLDTRRYCEDVSARIVNRTSKRLTYTFASHDTGIPGSGENQTSGDLNPGESKQLEKNASRTPSSKWLIYIYSMPDEARRVDATAKKE